VVANLPHAAAKAARHVPWRVVSHADRSFRKRAHQAPKKSRALTRLFCCV
jgi:hypothetical protein